MTVSKPEIQDAIVAKVHESRAVESGRLLLRTGDVFTEISEIDQRSAEWAQSTANAAAAQTAFTDTVGRSMQDSAVGVVATQMATEATRHTIDDMARLAESLLASVAPFKLA